MKTLVVASKDVKRLLKTPRFVFSLFLSSLAIIGLKVIFSPFLLQMFSFYLARFIFTFTLPFLLIAFLTSNSDIVASERSEGTILTIFTQPISNASIVLGKFVAMFLTSVAFASFNALLIILLHPYIWEMTGFINEVQFLGSFLLATILFLLPVGGLTLLFSSIFKRSAMVTILVVLAYEIPAIIYASQLTWEAPMHGIFPAIPIIQIFVMLIGSIPIIQIFVMLIGSILGYDLIRTVPVITVTEPEIIKYIPINVNAQRFLYFLTLTNPGIEFNDVLASILSILALTAITIILSLLVIKRWRTEYLE